MKFKTTAKAIRQEGGKVIACGYCEAWHLLAYEDAIAYTAGVYGWNFDVYHFEGVTICTGYRGMPGRWVDHNTIRDYEQAARKVYEDWNKHREEKQQEIRALLRELLAHI